MRAEHAAQARDGYGILLRVADADTIGISVDETTTVTELHQVAMVFGGAQERAFGFLQRGSNALPSDLGRQDEYLTHPVFHAHRSETAMMRYLKSLADRDYALDRGMIPLGSCTMKLNAATEMAAITWPEFAGIHPFAPAADVQGYLELIDQLEGLARRGHRVRRGLAAAERGARRVNSRGCSRSAATTDANGDQHRTICLIPSSAHGTNAASAVLAGMKVVVVATDELGNVDLDDLRAKVALHADDLSALMITYPSTHGVYEEQVVDITAAVHDAGGQVYVDGANLNPLCSATRASATWGGDVSHLNLHKTFAIPHGGGGPGIGPVAAKAHLAPFLPSHPLAQSAEHFGGYTFEGGVISAAPYGSAGILPISWAYVRMMGADGLRRATAAAVLSANYMAERLGAHFRCSTRARTGGWLTSASSICVRSRRPPASRSTTSPSASSTTASTRRPCRSRSRAR